MRPFGHATDLELDFGHPDRPGLVTALLAQCEEREHAAAFWWSQPVGGRIAQLLKLLALSEQCDDVSVNARCPADACGGTFEFDLPLHALAGAGGGKAPARVSLDAERYVMVRPAVGADLRDWREARPAARGDAVRVMLDSLVVEGEVRLDDETLVSAAIAALDPLVDFTVACRCPACGTASEVAVDLETLALSRLARRQRGMLEEVHRLASQYGWTEAEALAVPAARRARYLALIENDR